jgi:hypothetical protein
LYALQDAQGAGNAGGDREPTSDRRARVRARAVKREGHCKGEHGREREVDSDPVKLDGERRDENIWVHRPRSSSTPYVDRGGKKGTGLFIASVRQRNRAMFAVPLSEVERAFRKVGNDYPTDSHDSFDEETSDYKVTRYMRSPRARGPRAQRQ